MTTMQDVQPGMVVKIHQKIKEMTPKGEEKERIQMFEGTVIARRHGNEPGATVTVRKMSDGVAVEKIFPVHLPSIAKVEQVRAFKTRRAKLHFLRQGEHKMKVADVK